MRTRYILLEGFKSGRDVDFDADDAKKTIVKNLRNDGFSDFADVLECIDFYVVDIYKGEPVTTAFMIESEKVMCISPDFLTFTEVAANGDQIDTYTKLFKQVSVLVRHELLHFMLHHLTRFIDYLKKKYPKDWNWMKNVSIIHEQQNIAADYHLSQRYSDDDMEVVRRMTLCNEVVGGLILQDDHPEWLKLDFEDLLDKLVMSNDELKELIDEQIKSLPEVTIKKATHSQDYTDIYNKIIMAFDDVSDADLADIMDMAAKGEEIRDKKGNIIIKKGE